MPLDSNGNFIPLPGASNAATATKIKSQTQHNDLWADAATALSAKLDADGRKTMSGNLKMGANKITGIADAVDRADVPSYGQVQDSAASVLFPVGLITPFATPTAPIGWLKCDGAAVPRTTYANLFAALVTALGFTSKTFTVTIANPGVFNSTGHGFGGGERIRLSTTGSLPIGLATGVDYFVEYINVNAFYLTSTLFGARIITTGTQSGVHSYIQSLFGLGDGATTFNVPDLRGEFVRGWDNGRGVDPLRTIGSSQAQSIQAHTHDIVGGNVQSGSAPGSGFQQQGYYSYPKSFGGTETRPRNMAMLYCIKT